jgi:hypothetical protein
MPERWTQMLIPNRRVSVRLSAVERGNQVSEDVMSADSLVKENAELRADRALLRAYLSEARSELNDARAQSAALVEACEALADFIESYTPDSPLARAQPTFYSIFRVYGKNARAAVAAVRPQADALLAELAAARAVVAAVRQSSAIDEPQLHEAIAAYDAAIPKARE